MRRGIVAQLELNLNGKDPLPPSAASPQGGRHGQTRAQLELSLSTLGRRFESTLVGPLFFTYYRAQATLSRNRRIYRRPVPR